mmetsp:Transcript_52400/g.113550  ORF Transcript_52400/g.113550 Transcript_52400/m.113550 type:complete len:516 (-) Transcript_52400:152-1699(-)|eukprot:CAMPEP_0170650430 /NCGR_PEP_ID=MMETSP0224-20130122/45799_1 /TAXON_ID=285029 /ORGANISM="Togula jolla, Strain CCCM 725" /LENGTH=515 /DNA_ID=CAMNT_0010982093 /DNA_START=52 /DNA_END=1599 /DNA_ORIENTATION=+
MAEDGQLPDAIKAMLAEKGYDLTDEKDGDSSDSDPGIPGRITSVEPNLAREKGKAAFEKGKYDKAIRYWQGGLKHILSALCSGPEALGNQSLSELDLTLNLNIAMAYIKKGDFEAADRSIEKALARRDALPNNLITKALYRKASVQRSMHRLEECLETIRDLLSVEATHAAARQMQQEVEREWQKQCRDQKSNLKKMFSKLAGEDKEAVVAQQQARMDARIRSGVRWMEGDVDSEAFCRGNTPGCDGKDWQLAFNRTVLWSIEEFAVEGCTCLPAESSRGSLWFVGASSTCELRQLQAKTLMSRLPALKVLELVLIGFLGDLDPDNSRTPDPRADSLPQGLVQTSIGGDRRILFRAIKGTLKEALATDLAQGTEASGSPAVSSEAPGQAEAESAAIDTLPMVPPSICIIAHPQLHRYFTDFFPAISWLIVNKVPTVIIGASEPDHSWKQDETLLRAVGANIVVSKRESPYPMCLPDNPKIKKCNHIIGFHGGKALEPDKLTKKKLELLSQDYSVR